MNKITSWPIRILFRCFFVIFFKTPARISSKRYTVEAYFMLCIAYPMSYHTMIDLRLLTFKLNLRCVLFLRFMLSFICQRFSFFNPYIKDEHMISSLETYGFIKPFYTFQYIFTKKMVFVLWILSVQMLSSLGPKILSHI